MFGRTVVILVLALFVVALLWTKARSSGPILWFLWGAVAAVCFFTIFSIGLPLFVLSLIPLVLFLRRRLPGAAMVVVGAGTFFSIVGVEVLLDPVCRSAEYGLRPDGSGYGRCLEYDDRSASLLWTGIAVAAVGLLILWVSRRVRGALGT